MQKSSSHTGILIITIVVILAAIGYFYVQGSSAPAGAYGLVSDSGDVGLASVNLLNQIQGIKMDTTLFQNPAYLGLVDHTVSIPAQNVGRANPFAPIPGVGNPSAPAATK